MTAQPGARHATDESEVAEAPPPGPNWNEFYARHLRVVLASARCLGAPDCDLEDVAVDVFERARSLWSRFRSGSEAAWLRAITCNVVRELRRHQRSRSQIVDATGQFERVADLDDVSMTPEQRLAQQQDRELVWRLLDQLSPRQREILIHRDIDGFTAREVADLLSLQADTVDSHLFMARRNFRTLLEKEQRIHADAGEERR